jgi:hypothetical protein
VHNKTGTPMRMTLNLLFPYGELIGSVPVRFLFPRHCELEG